MRQVEGRPPDPAGGKQGKMNTVESWVMVLAAFGVMAHTPGVHYVFSLFFVELLEEFPSQSRAAVAGCGSLSTCIMLGAAYLSGKLQVRFTGELVVLMGGVAASVGLLLASYSTQLWHLYATFGVLVGFSHAMTFPPSPVIVSRWFDESRRGLACGMATSGSGAGTIYLGAIAPLLYRRLGGWRGAFRAIALFSFLCITAAGLVFRDPSGQRLHIRAMARLRAVAASSPAEASSKEQELQGSQHLGGGEPKESTDGDSKENLAPHQGKASVSARDLLLLPRLRLLCGSFFLLSFAWELPFIHLVRYALDEGVDSDFAQKLVLGIGAGGIVGRIALSACIDVYGPDMVFRFVLGLLAGLDLALPFFAGTQVFLMAYAIGVGSVIGSLVALVVPLVAVQMDPVAVPQASGLIYSCLCFGICAGPPLAGMMFTVSGSYDSSFWAAGSFVLAAFGLTWFLPQNQHAQQRGESPRPPGEVPPEKRQRQAIGPHKHQHSGHSRQ